MARGLKRGLAVGLLSLLAAATARADDAVVTLADAIYSYWYKYDAMGKPVPAGPGVYMNELSGLVDVQVLRCEEVTPRNTIIESYFWYKETPAGLEEKLSSVGNGNPVREIQANRGVFLLFSIDLITAAHHPPRGLCLHAKMRCAVTPSAIPKFAPVCSRARCSI